MLARVYLADSRDSGTGCVHTHNPTPWDDGNACPTGDACSGGGCTSGGPTNCDDGDACTADSCLPGSGCQHTDTSALCDDGNPCTTDSCNPSSGCVHVNNTNPCNDGEVCTTNDACSGGICIGGGPTVCDDGNACTSDSCVAGFGCQYTDISSSCDDGNVCTDDSCNPASGCVHVNNSGSCDDGDACTQSDTCSSGSCVGGGAPNCDDENPCTNDSCDSEVGCVNADNGVCTDDPKRRKFWKKVLRGRIPGEVITQADIACIQESCLFPEVNTLQDVFDKLARGSSEDSCLRAESHMMALVINMCRYRILPSRLGQVKCSDGPTVGAMRSEAETLMCTPQKTQDQCSQAKCIAARINKKRFTN